MPRPRLLAALALACASLATVLAASAPAATTRTATAPADLRAGYSAYRKAITAGFATATRVLDRELRRHPRRPAVVLDIDETTMSNWACLDAVDFALDGLANCVVGSKSVAFPAARTFVRHAQRRYVSVAFITGAPEALCAARTKNLVAQGIRRPFSITCRPASDTRDTVVPYKSGARRALQREGRTIVLDVGDQRSDLAGGTARRTVRLPNPIYVID